MPYVCAAAAGRALRRGRKDVCHLENGELSWRERGRLWLRLGIQLLGLVCFVLGVRYVAFPLLRLLMPFVLALVAAWLLNPLVRILRERLGLSRGILSVALILLAVGVISGVFIALGLTLFGEVRSLAENWSSIWLSIQQTFEELSIALDRLLEYLPSGLEQFIDDNLEHFNQWLGGLVNSGVRFAGGWATGFAFSIPTFVVAFIVFLLAAYFITADYPGIMARAREHMPEGLRAFAAHIRTTALGALAGYVRAEIIISVAVFFILTAGFFIIDQPYGLLLALLFSVLDFIPIIGSGTIMVPWAVVDLFLGDWSHAAGLMVVWGVVCVFRRVAEPKAVGSQTGLSPILSLMSMYVGMQLAGVLGMILGPIVCLVAISICRTGIFDGLLMDVGMAVRDMAALLNSRPGPGRGGDQGSA